MSTKKKLRYSLKNIKSTATHCITKCRVPVSVLSWQSKKNKRVVHSSFAAEASCMSSCQQYLDWISTLWVPMTFGEFVLENDEQFPKARPSPSLIEMVIIKAKAVSGGIQTLTLRFLRSVCCSTRVTEFAS